MRRARERAGSIANRVLDLGIYIIIARAGRREAAAAGRRLRSVPAVPRRAADAGAVRRRVLRRPDPGGRSWRSGTSGKHRHAALDDLRRVRAGHRAGTRRSGGSAAWPPAAATASRPTCRGPITFTESAGSRERRHAAGRAAASDAALRSGRRAADPASSCSRPRSGAAASPAARSGSYMLLYAVSRFVIEFYRGDPRGMMFGDVSTSQFISLRARAARVWRCCCICRRRSTAARRHAADARARRRLGGRERVTSHVDEPSVDSSVSSRLRPEFTVPTTATVERLDRFLVVGPRRSTRDRRSSGSSTRAASRVAGVGRQAEPGRCAKATRCRGRHPGAGGRRTSWPRRCRSPILYQDADVVVREQAGRHGGASRRPVTPPARSSMRCSTTSTDLSGIGGELRPGIVHRLDRGHVGRDGRRQERRGAPGAGARSSRIARSKRNTSRSSGAWSRPDGGSTRRSAATRPTGRRCRRAPGARGRR